jgi:hypothetical protein
MRVVCAWCKREMGIKPPLEDKRVTHGMCVNCYKKEMALLKKMRQKLV